MSFNAIFIGLVINVFISILGAFSDADLNPSIIVNIILVIIMLSGSVFSGYVTAKKSKKMPLINSIIMGVCSLIFISKSHTSGFYTHTMIDSLYLILLIPTVILGWLIYHTKQRKI